MLGGADTSNLETRTTVGLYTGPDNRGNPIENREAWLVVVDNIPISFPSGPYTSPENRVHRTGQRQQNSWSCSTTQKPARKSGGPSRGAGLRTRKTAGTGTGLLARPVPVNPERDPMNHYCLASTTLAGLLPHQKMSPKF